LVRNSHLAPCYYCSVPHHPAWCKYHRRIGARQQPCLRMPGVAVAFPDSTPSTRNVSVAVRSLDPTCSITSLLDRIWAYRGVTVCMAAAPAMPMATRLLMLQFLTSCPFYSNHSFKEGRQPTKASKQTQLPRLSETNT
jgi:hypothetical protein